MPSIHNEKLCKECAITKFEIPRERILFLEEYVKFRKEHRYDEEYRWDSWSKALLRQFINQLEKKNIPIQLYGFPLWQGDTDGKALINEYRRMRSKEAYDMKNYTFEYNGNDEETVDQFEQWLKSCPVKFNERE